jgi:hypothetical protein
MHITQNALFQQSIEFPLSIYEYKCSHHEHCAEGFLIEPIGLIGRNQGSSVQKVLNVNQPSPMFSRFKSGGSWYRV